MFQMACSLFINDIIPDTFSLTSERTGVAIFTDELAAIVANNLHRSGRNRVQRIDESEERKSAPYPLPVMKEIAFFLKIKKIAKNTSFICDKHPEILEEFTNIIDGKYTVDEYKGIQYIQKGTGRKLFLSECSSSVKSLVELYFYLQCCARPNQVLMVDEPELTLHPENLRKLAEEENISSNIEVTEIKTNGKSKFNYCYIPCCYRISCDIFSNSPKMFKRGR